jgi:histidinol-phosphatase (PHP family)
VPADYHTHTPLCRHATGSPEEYVAAAIAAGLTEYGISDHAPARPEPFDDWRMLESELPEYFEWIDRARAAAGTLPIRAGMECDWLPGCESWIEDLYLGTWDFDNPKWLGRWAESDVDQVWTLYWEAYADMARSRLFDVLGHPDLVKKFSHRPAGDLDRFYEPAIAAIAASGCAIELNTAGWHKPCAEAYPHPRFLELAHQAGVPLVISSDSHAPTEVARDFPQAIAWARSAGYHETLLFKHRNRSIESID